MLPPTTAPPGPPPTMPTMPTTDFPETTTEEIEMTTPTEMPTTEEPTETEGSDPTTIEPTPDPRKDQYFHHFHRMARQSENTDLSCVFMVYKTSSDIQQMRIDFIDLEVLILYVNFNLVLNC